MYTEEITYLLTNLPPLPVFGEPPKISFGDIIKVLKGFQNKHFEKLLHLVLLYPVINYLLSEKLKINFISYSTYAQQDQQNVTEIPSTDAHLVSSKGHLDNELIEFIKQYEFPPNLEKIYNSDIEIYSSEAEFITKFWVEYLFAIVDWGMQNQIRLLQDWGKFEITLRSLLEVIRKHGIIGRETTAKVRCDELYSKIVEDSNYDSKSRFIIYEMISSFDFSSIIMESCNAHDPLSLEKTLDRARIRYLDEHATHYSFTIDELIDYLLRLAIYWRYYMLSEDVGYKILKEVSKYEP